MPEAIPPVVPPVATPPVDHAKDIADLKTQNAALLARLDKLSPIADPAKDPALIDTVRKESEEKQKKATERKALESALKFGMTAPDWLKSNESLLPKDVKEIFSAADKEKYETEVEKDAAIKAGIVQSFFAVQANLDLLTPTLKNNLEEFLGLTKNGKQEKAQQVYDSIFEPTFEMLRRVKKAAEISKGHGQSTDDETVYKNKMIALSKQHYLGEK